MSIFSAVESKASHIYKQFPRSDISTAAMWMRYVGEKEMALVTTPQLGLVKGKSCFVAEMKALFPKEIGDTGC